MANLEEQGGGGKQAWLRWLRRPSVIMLLLVTALVAFGAIQHYRLKWKVIAVRQQLEARGETFSPMSLMPAAPPSDSNSATAFSSAMRSLRSISMHLPPAMPNLGSGHTLVWWRQDPLPDFESVNLWSLIARDIETHGDALVQLRQAAEGPIISFPVDSRGSNFRLIDLSYLSSMKEAIQWLRGATLFELHRGDVASANSNLCAAVGLLRHHQPEPVLVSHLVRISICAICVNVTWQALQHPEWTDEDLARLQDAWTGTDLLAELEVGIRMSRIQALGGIEQLRRDPHAADLSLTPSASTNALDEIYEMGKRIAKSPRKGFDAMANRYLGYFVWKWWWSYGDEVLIMERMQTVADAAHRLRTGDPAVPLLAQTKRLVGEGERTDPDSSDYDWSSPRRLSIDSTLRTLQKMIMVAPQRELVIAAIALKRFYLAQGHLPEKLDELVPRFLPAVPRDLMDGAPLRYQRRTDGSFLLYSVGEDGLDQGGDPRAPDRNPIGRNWYLATDMVWPEPGTAEEVAAYEKKIVAELLRNQSKIPAADWDQLRLLVERYGLPTPGTNVLPHQPVAIESK